MLGRGAQSAGSTPPTPPRVQLGFRATFDPLPSRSHMQPQMPPESVPPTPPLKVSH